MPESTGRDPFSRAPLVDCLRSLDYGEPVASMRHHLEAMQAGPYSLVPPAEPPKTLIAALTPKTLALAAEKADGAQPYLTTPEHAAQAREILGPDELPCVEQKIALSSVGPRPASPRAST